jgi:hypothetical protein
MLASLAMLAITPALIAGPKKGPDIIITNARVYTVNAKHPWADAVAISGDRIAAVGSIKEVEKLRGTDTQMIDAKGHLVLPGITDSHIHFLEGSRLLTQLDLTGVTSITEVQKRVKEYAASHPNLTWIQGRGWSYELFGEKALPDKKYLDEVVPDRAVYLVGFDGHTSWANSKALEIVGFARNTPDPPNGKIVRDEKGEPTGALKEEADDIAESRAPAPAREQQLEALRLGMREANRVGLVRVHCLSNAPDAVDDLRNGSLYEELRRTGQLTVRMYLSYYMDPPTVSPVTMAAVEQSRQRYNDDWIAAGAVKFFLDGVIESHTAAMLRPYSDDPSLIGKLFWDENTYKNAVAELDKRGIQIFTHAIGDRAVRLAFDAYENAAKTNHTKDQRHRIEHIETISAQDIPRFGKLGVIASYQPLHAEPNPDTMNVWVRNAGPDRASRGWAWQSVAQAGGHLAFGSDWPVVTLNPWYGVQNAVTRQNLQGKPVGGWLPEQRVSLEQAIEAYTLGAAFAGHRETTEGSIEKGKLADLIMLDRDLFTIAPGTIHETQVLLTMVGGKVAYQAPAPGAENPK